MNSISFILPVYNEQGNIAPLVSELNQFLSSREEDYELIIVDDGSTDGSKQIIKKLEKENKKIKAFYFSHNLGKSFVLRKGFKEAGKEIVFFMDSDLQYSVQDIPKFLDKLEQGYDAVNGWRRERNDPELKKLLPSLFYNFFTRFLLGPNVHDHNCGFKAFKRNVLSDLKLKIGYHRFILPLLAEKGYQVTSVEVHHYPRKKGRPKYSSPFRLIRGAKDMFHVLGEIIELKVKQTCQAKSDTRAPE